MQPSHPRSPPPAAQGQHHAFRRGGSGPAGVERSLRPVLGAPPQVSTPAALGSRPLGASWGPPAFRGPSPGAPPPALPGLLSSWGLRASLLRCFSHRPRLAPLSCLQPPGAGRGPSVYTWKKSTPGPRSQLALPGGKQRGGGGDSGAGRERLATRRWAPGSHFSLAVPPTSGRSSAPPSPPPGPGLRAPGGCRKGKRREPA